MMESLNSLVLRTTKAVLVVLQRNTWAHVLLGIDLGHCAFNACASESLVISLASTKRKYGSDQYISLCFSYNQ